MRLAFALALLLTAVPALAQPASPFGPCAQRTGRAATLLLPASAELTLDGAPLRAGDLVAALTPEGVCAGIGTYAPGEPLVFAIWENDVFTEEADGFRDGEALAFHVFRTDDGASGFVNGAAAEVTYDATFSAPATFSADALYVVTRLPMASAASSTEGGLPLTFALEGAYPNPFRGRTTLTYRLPAAAEVSLEVFDLLGRRVATLVDALQTPGTYEVSFDPSQANEPLAAGVYLARLRAGEQTATVRITLVR